MKRFAISACLMLALSATASLAQRRPATDDLRERYKKASVNGKYSMLLRQIHVPQDGATAGDFIDYGRWDGAEWAGFTNLPPGYWVYSSPYWYIWRDLAADPKPDRPWGPEQATGPPNTQSAGDLPTAWASLSPDNQSEWLLLEYAEPVIPTHVKIYETFNPGAVTRISAFNAGGDEAELWKGKDTTASADGLGVLSVPVKPGFAVMRIKVEIDSPAHPGWNEIDAVGLVGEDGKTHWAASAAASSTYAEQEAPESETDAIIKQLEQQIQQLADQVRALKERLSPAGGFLSRTRILLPEGVIRYRLLR